MKMTLKKLLALITVMAMVLSLAACGGGSGGGSSEAPAEANAGVAEIVFSVPEAWTCNSATLGDYVSYKTESGLDFGVSVFDEEDLENSKQWDPEQTAENIQEYFEQSNTKQTDEELKERGTERTKVTVCGVDGYQYAGSSDNGVVGLSTSFLYNGKSYLTFLDKQDVYDDEGKVKKDAPAISADDMKAYESILASIQSGDGDAMLKGSLTADSIGSIAFEVPEGYSVTSVSDTYITLAKDGSEVTINCNLITEDELKWYEDENGNHPESLEAEYKNRTEYMGDEDKATIAGFDGYKNCYPFEDDKYYYTSAMFLGNDGIYDFDMSTPAWDADGNIKEGAVELTEADREVFDNFVASLKAK
ncbi:MAG: hypothetical protein IJH28_02225 [Mogibacterium sp.]|nr:hypothetical protein [Mogibacterium sp.]MBQ6500907.1 hypothetical protein [Mogibacterium sp.]